MVGDSVHDPTPRLVVEPAVASGEHREDVANPGLERTEADDHDTGKQRRFPQAEKSE